MLQDDNFFKKKLFIISFANSARNQEQTLYNQHGHSGRKQGRRSHLFIAGFKCPIYGCQHCAKFKTNLDSTPFSSQLPQAIKILRCYECGSSEENQGGSDKRFPVRVQATSSLFRTGKLFASRFANFAGILGISVLSIILSDLLGNRCSFQRVLKVMVCNLRLVDFDPFLFQESLRVSVLFRAIIDLSAAVLIFLTKCSAINSPG